MVHTNFRRLLALGALAYAACGSGCSTMNNTERGAAIGGAGGAGVGAAIGAATGRPLLGAAVGGLSGAVVGGAVGNDIDKREQRDREVAQAAALADAQAAGQRVGVFDVIRMVQEGQDDQVIINQIRSTGSTFSLTASDLSELKTERGVRAGHHGNAGGPPGGPANTSGGTRARPGDLRIAPAGGACAPRADVLRPAAPLRLRLRRWVLLPTLAIRPGLPW